MASAQPVPPNPFRQYVAAGFHVISDGTAGSVISYSTVTSGAHVADLAPKAG